MKSYKDGIKDEGVKTIKELIEKNSIVPTTESLLNLLNSGIHSPDNLNSILKYMCFKGLEITNECVDAIVDNNILNTKIIDFIVENGFKPSKECISRYIDRQFTHYDPSVSRPLYLFIKCYPLDVTEMNRIIDHLRFYNFKLANINEILQEAMIPFFLSFR